MEEEFLRAPQSRCGEGVRVSSPARCRSVCPEVNYFCWGLEDLCPLEEVGCQPREEGVLESLGDVPRPVPAVVRPEELRSEEGLEEMAVVCEDLGHEV